MRSDFNGVKKLVGIRKRGFWAIFHAKNLVKQTTICLNLWCEACQLYPCEFEIRIRSRDRRMRNPAQIIRMHDLPKIRGLWEFLNCSRNVWIEGGHLFGRRRRNIAEPCGGIVPNPAAVYCTVKHQIRHTKQKRARNMLIWHLSGETKYHRPNEHVSSRHLKKNIWPKTSETLRQNERNLKSVKCK